MVKRVWRSFGIVVVLILVLSAVSDAGVLGQGGGIDLVLLIDSSESTAGTDPQDLRIQAAEFLLDYVQAVGEAQGVTHRFAMANFNTEILDEIPWTFLQGEAGRDQLVARSEGGTDFAPALEYALALREDSGMRRPMVIILFTDGTPDPAEDLQDYFDDLQSTVEALQDSGAHIFVVAVGDEAAEADKHWEDSTESPGLLPPAHYERVAGMRDLSGTYRRWLAGFLGLTADEQGTRFLAAAETTEIRVDPYLEQLVISVFPDGPQTEVEVLDASSDPVSPARAGGAVYVRNAPWPPGTWRVTMTGDGAQVWVDRRYAVLQLRAPALPQPLGDPIVVEGNLVRSGVVIDDDDLTLEVDVIAPGGRRTSSFPLTRKAGRYEGELTDLTAEGVYSLILSAAWSSQAVGARQTDPVTMSVHTVPSIAAYEIHGERHTSQVLTVTATISHAERVGPETKLFARLTRADGSTVEAPTLHDDGRAPDVQANDGVFTALVPLPDAEGNYRLGCVIQGVSRDGVILDIKSDVTNLDVFRSVPEATETPVVMPTPTPPSLNPPDDIQDITKRYFWPIMGAIGSIGVLGLIVVVLWYLFQAQQTRADRLDNKRVRITPKIWSLWRQRNSEARRADQATVNFEEQCQLAQEAIKRAEEAEKEAKRLRKATVWENVEKLLERIRDNRITTSELEKVTEKLVHEISSTRQATDALAYKSSEEAFLSLFQRLRNDNKIEQYRQTIIEYTYHPDFVFVRATASALSKIKEQSVWVDRDAWEVMQDFYYVVSNPRESNQASKEYISRLALLKALSEAEGSAASLCLCIYEACISPKPDYEQVIAAIHLVLEDRGDGLKATYQLLQRLVQAPCELSLENQWDRAVEQTNENANGTGPQVVYDLLIETKRHFFGEQLKKAFSDDLWREAVVHLTDSVKELSLQARGNSLPEFVLLLRAIYRWQEYAIARSRDNSDGYEMELALDSWISLELYVQEEQVLHSGAWKFDVPVILHNKGRLISSSIVLQTICSNGFPEELSQELQFPAILPDSAVSRNLKAQTRTKAMVTIEGAQDKALTLGTLNIPLKPQSYEQKEELEDPLLQRFNQLWEHFEEAKDNKKKHQIFALRGLRGCGRSTLLERFYEKMDDNKFLAIQVDLREFETSTPDRLSQAVWHSILEQAQKALGSRPIDIPTSLKLNDFEDRLFYILEKPRRNLCLILKGTEVLAQSRFGNRDQPDTYDIQNSLGLELVPGTIKGILVVSLDYTPQPWEVLLYGRNIPSEYPVGLLNEQKTKTLIRYCSKWAFSELAQKALWVYSGGHAGFISLVCSKLAPESPDGVCVADVKRVVRETLKMPQVELWFSMFSFGEHLLLRTLAKEDFTQPETGLLVGLHRQPNVDSNAANWRGVELLMTTFRKNGYRPNREEIIAQLERMVQHQVLGMKDENSWAVRWRVGWIYAMVRRQRPRAYNH